MHPADLDVVRLVPRVLGELARRGRLDDLAAHAAREPDPLALDVGAGVASAARSASASPRNSSPTSSRIVSALCSMIARPSSPRTSNGAMRPGQERRPDRRGRGGGPPGGRRGRRSAVGERCRSSVVPRGCGFTRCGRRGATASSRLAASSAAPVAVGWSGGRSTTAARFGNGAVRCGIRHRVDEVLLEARLDGGLDLLDASATTSSISRRAAPLTSAMRAPVPAALPAALTWLSSRPGRARGPSRGAGRSGCRTRRRAGSRRPSRCRAWSISSRTPA